jgi:hypothetical protein
MKAAARISSIIVVACIGLTVIRAHADSRASAWKQEELNEQLMRSLTKSQCMAKTIAALMSGCSSKQCIKTLGGITGDCVSWAIGDISSFCAAFDREYIASYCNTNEMDARQCTLLKITKATFCKEPSNK